MEASLNTSVKSPSRYLALGDSYTLGTSLTDESDRYPLLIAEKLNADGIPCSPPHTLANNGWTSSDLLEATNRFTPDTPFDLVSLLIGANNQYQGKSIDEYEDEFSTLLERAISFAGDNPSQVFVFSIPDYSITPSERENAEKTAKELIEYNDVNKRITESYNISYFDIKDISRRAAKDSSLIASDGSHPSGKMHNLLVAEFIDEIKTKTQ